MLNYECSLPGLNNKKDMELVRTEELVLFIKKYYSTSYGGMRKVQIGFLYIMYSRSFIENKSEECKNI